MNRLKAGRFFLPFFILFVFGIAVTASASVYLPGQTLNPDCVMGSANCGVNILSQFVPFSGASTTIDLNNQSLLNINNFAIGSATTTFSSTSRTYIGTPVQNATTTTGNCPWGIAASGNYAYVTNQCDDTLEVYNVSNPLSPVPVASTTFGISPNYLAISGNYAYVAGSPNDVDVINISNPLSPVQVATTTVGSGPNAVAISGAYAYVVNTNDNTISVVNISNPAAAVQVATTSVGLSPTGIAVSGNYVYVTADGGNTISVVNISNPLAPHQTATTTVGTNPIAIAVSGNYAYVANNVSNTVSVLNISNPASPTVAGTVSVGTNPDWLDISGTNIYVVNGGSNNISIVDVSNPALPVQTGVISVGGFPSGIAVSGDYAYAVNDNDNTMSVVKIANTISTSNTSLLALKGFGSIPLANILTNAGVPAFSIAANGDVGIGTTTPATVFSVIGTTTLSNLNLSGLASGVLTVDANGNVFATSSTLSQWNTAGSNIWYAAGGVKIGNSAQPIGSADWATGTFPVSNASWISIAYGNGIFVAAGDGSQSAISSNGTVWTSGTMSSSDYWDSMTYGNGQFVAMDGRHNHYAVSTNGTSWTGGTMPSPHPTFFAWSWRVAYGNGLFVAVGGDQFATSSDGTHWATSSLPVSAANFESLIYANGRFVGVNNNSATVESTNGEQWTAGTLPSPMNNGYSITYGNSMFVIVGSDSSNNNRIATSPDGINWSLVTPPTTNLWVSVAYSNGLFIAVANGTSFGASLDGVNWTTTSFSQSQLLNAIAAGAGYFVGIGSNNNFVTVNPGSIKQPATLEVFGSTGTDIANFMAPSSKSVLYIASNGNIGIGTTTPANVLTVNGTIASYSDASHISEVATTSVGLYPQNIIISGHYAYVSSNYDNRANGNPGTNAMLPGSNPFSVVDISNPLVPKQIATTTVGGASSIALAKSGHYVYVVNNGEFDHSISVMDVANPANPQLLATSSVTGTYPVGIAISGHYAYVSVAGLIGAEHTIDVFDISNPYQPKVVATTSVEDGPTGIAISGNYAYVGHSTLGATTSSNIISVLDISNPLALHEIASTTVGTDPANIAISGRYAYVANSDSNYISVVDISNPFSPIEVASTTVGNNPMDIAVAGNYVYTADQVGEMSVVNVANPLLPFLVAAIPTASWCQGVAVSGRYVYTANSEFNGDSFAAGSVSVIDTGGIDAESMRVGSLEAGLLNVDNSLSVDDMAHIGTALSVGTGGILSNGALAVTATNTPSYFADSVGIGTSTPTANLT
ncbi:beta-propeller fold lactonase family protein, partial [Patescibacteria group bacterium]|nr:beta-propeller fold lactonase family protein [Patescibacteria group bacterium]